MNKILFPTDFSDSSLSVMNYAAAFCKQTNAVLVLFHAMLAPVVQADGPMINAQEIMDEQKKAIKNKLEKMATKIRSKYEIVVSTRTDYGFSGETICEAATETQASLIILAAQGETNVFDKFFGNVTLDLFKKAKIPVLSVPEKAKFSDIKKIAFASSDIDYDAVEIFDLIKLTAHFNPQIKLVHIKQGKDFEKETFEENKNIEYVEIEGSEEAKSETLLKYLADNDIDMVCVKKYKLPFFYNLFHKSFTEELFYHSNMPLLVFKDE